MSLQQCKEKNNMYENKNVVSILFKKLVYVF